jgi:hypothetical protein
MKYLKELVKEKGYQLRNSNQVLKQNESIENVSSVFDFSDKNGGTYDGFKYYNNYYLYKNNQ